MKITRGSIAALLLGVVLAFPAFFGASWAREQVVSGYPTFSEGDELWGRKTGTTNTKEDVTVTSGSLNVNVTGGTVATTSSAPTAASIRAGSQSYTATQAATTIITIPAGNSWVGDVMISASVSTVAGTATAGQALGVVTTTGAGTTPAAGQVMDCEARNGANGATGTVGSQGNNSCRLTMIVNCASGTCTLAGATTQAGTNSRVSFSASGRLY